MKKLIILRHAKSSWKDNSLDDHQRPLNARGNAAVPVIGKWLVDNGHFPDTVLCSSSVRTCQTAEKLGMTMPGFPDPVVEADLYHAAPGTLLARLRELPGACQTAMIIGHQPGLATLTRMLADGRENRHCQNAYEHFPTAAAAVLEIESLAIDSKWQTLDYRMARFVDFAKPRELMDT